MNNKPSYEALVQRVETLEGELARKPQVYGGATQVGLSKELQQTVQRSEKLAAEMRDDFVSTEHLLLALTEDRAGGPYRSSWNGV